MPCRSLSSNFFSGEIPTNVLSRNPGLATLSLGNNVFRGCVPEQLYQSCGEDALECRTWNATDRTYTEGTSAADQACGTLPVCDTSVTSDAKGNDCEA